MEWRFFSSEDMMKGNKTKKKRQSRITKDKENVYNDNSAQSTPSSTPRSAILNTPQSTSSFASMRRTPVCDWSSTPGSRPPLSNITNISNNRSHTSQTYNERDFGSVSQVDTQECHDQLGNKPKRRKTGRIALQKENVSTDNSFNSKIPENSIIRDGYVSDDDSSNESNDEFCTEDVFCEEYDTDLNDNVQPPPNVQTKNRRKTVFPVEYCSLGAPTAKCIKCNALIWKEERVNKNVTKGTPIFSLCCKKGEVKLPDALPTPPYLLELHTNPVSCAKYQRTIRPYNSIFSFTSSGGNVDHSINTGRGPYIYRLNGQNHHIFGSLIPDGCDTPKFCQLYIYDTGNEVNNWLRWVNAADQQSLDAEVVQGLINMLDETNELFQKFSMTRDHFESNDLVDLKVELKVCRAQSGRENHIAAIDDVAGVMVGGSDTTTPNRDIIVESKMDKLQRVSYIHPKLMSLLYPLLFPNGEDGYHNKIRFQSADPNSEKERDMISMKDYYSYRFQVRLTEGMAARLGGRLFQQYMVDAFSAIEHTRLWWFHINQTVLRNELYSNICDSVCSGDASTSNVGKGIILPTGYVGSKHYMQQNFQDALAVCRHVGC
ncbi:uncharacterized protein LOC141701674 isoform X1 [Apium graveolens]|uniref:uncharacterized protein LOC141701674 isoform X1 n=1 Tax=Apium graveolens TaxID=4045 RepID=UPI003D797B08